MLGPLTTNQKTVKIRPNFDENLEIVFLFDKATVQKPFLCFDSQEFIKFIKMLFIIKQVKLKKKKKKLKNLIFSFLI